MSQVNIVVPVRGIGGWVRASRGTFIVREWRGDHYVDKATLRAATQACTTFVLWCPLNEHSNYLHQQQQH